MNWCNYLRYASRVTRHAEFEHTGQRFQCVIRGDEFGAAGENDDSSALAIDCASRADLFANRRSSFAPNPVRSDNVADFVR